MLRFLSRFSLTTRIYISFLILGCYVVLVCFASVLAAGYVHREYTRANSVIENTRQISALENNLFTLKRALYFFAMKGTEEEKNAVEEAYASFDEKSKEIEGYLDIPEVREKYKSVTDTFLNKYRSDMSEMFSLHDKSVNASEKVNGFAEKASNQLNALIEETTLPSATFVLNGLREQLDVVLQSIDAASAGNAESQKQLNADFAALKKAQNAARQAEMVNTKQLKNLISSFNGLEEEINRKLKIDKTLHEKLNGISSFDDENSKEMNELLNIMAQSCIRLLSQAEEGKIRLQKAFVLAAAVGGILAIVLSFLSLFGIRYPLSRLIENAREMARGEPSVQIYFTDRDDEIGALAKALSALLARMNEFPALSSDLFRNYQNVTAGSSFAYASAETNAEYKTVTSKDASAETEFAYFGEGVGVDTESQLYQMLYLVQHISASASDLTENIRKITADCLVRLQSLGTLAEEMKERSDAVESREEEMNTPAVLSKSKDLADALAVCVSGLDEMQTLLLKQNVSFENLALYFEQARNFVPKLTEWGRVATELLGMIHSLSAETKILALNASIEAAKVGENAREFGAVSLDMRHKTAETADISEKLASHLVVIRDEAGRFINEVNEIGAGIDEAYNSLRMITSCYAEQNENVKKMFEAAENIRDELSRQTEERNARKEDFSLLKECAEKTAEIRPDLNDRMDEIGRLLDEFSLSLPTYEDGKENADGADN